jgi:thiol-disulfide isomerase/thioredoxin
MLKKILSISAYVIIIVLLGLVIRYFAYNPVVSSSSVSNAAINSNQFFSSTLIDTNNVKTNLEQYRGKIIVLNFWATWCPPCREEMPELSQLQTAYKNKNVVVLGVAIDELAAVNEYLQTSPVTYPILLSENESMDLAIQLGNAQAVLPYTVIIDADGNVIDTFLGRITLSLLEISLQKLMPQ